MWECFRSDFLEVESKILVQVICWGHVLRIKKFRKGKQNRGGNLSKDVVLCIE